MKRHSKRWIDQHRHDEFVKLAQQHGLRSRAIFKLKEINERDKLLKAGIYVVDLGASPGGWSEYTLRRIGHRGKIIALDLLPMDEIGGVEFIQGDFRNDDVLARLNEAMDGNKLDVVLSDMAPNLSGVSVVDQARAMHLAELALETAKDSLKIGGDFLVKLFQGSGFNEFRNEAHHWFNKVMVRKPKASRPRSREIYLLARGFKFYK